MMAGVRPNEFDNLTIPRYNLIIEAHHETQKADMYRDLRNDYYTGVFAQASKPQEFYEQVLESLDAKPQSGADIFGFLKNMASMAGKSQENINAGFRIPLKLTPEFDVNVFSYIYRAESGVLELYLPDVALSINGVMLKSENGLYVINLGPSSMVNIKYESVVYAIVIIRG